MRQRGFTLIELLVVISIIALLSSVVMSSLNTARAKAREAARLRDIATLRTAFNLYAADNGGALPNYGTSCLGLPTGQTCWTGYNSGFGGNNGLNAALQPYLSQIPLDPTPTRSVGNAYIYWRGSGDVRCGASPTVSNANWIAWQPETISPSSDARCGAGTYACCSGLGCGTHNFCMIQL